MNDFGLYLVMTDPIVGYQHCAEAAVRAGVKMLQLRMKNVARTEVLAVARDVRTITRHTETTFILNDDPELAAEVEADGVHLGQTDMPLIDARNRYPQLKIFGLSTHNPTQVQEARLQAPDYIGVGPVYATPTKAIPDPTLGLDVMRQMLDAAPCPAVAIGGISWERLPEVLRVGARNVAIVRAVCQSLTPYRTLCLWQEAMKAAQEIAQ
jgi:thiamine-phosphate pyrophosphorylase